MTAHDKSLKDFAQRATAILAHFKPKFVFGTREVPEAAVGLQAELGQ